MTTSLRMRDILDPYRRYAVRFRKRQWSVLCMYYDEEMTQSEIAQRLGIGQNSVSCLLKRARQTMLAIDQEERMAKVEMILRAKLRDGE